MKANDSMCATRRLYFATALLSLLLLLTRSASADDSKRFDGNWHGFFSFAQAPLSWAKAKPGAGLNFRLVVDGANVRVFIVQKDRTVEFKPGAFHISAYMTNAVVFATDSGSDEEGTWVETVAFTLTQKNATTLLADYSRVVNNLNLPSTSDHSKFAVVGIGELKRAP
jgi:hypothetical protein